MHRSDAQEHDHERVLCSTVVTRVRSDQCLEAHSDPFRHAPVGHLPFGHVGFLQQSARLAYAMPPVAVALQASD
jgi:hypothetical protein